MDWYFFPSNRLKNSKHILASMIYFDSDMSKSTHTVVYFDWKTVFFYFIFTFAENVAHNLCCHWKSQSHSPAHVRMRVIPSINRLFVYKAKEGRYVRIRK